MRAAHEGLTLRGSLDRGAYQGDELSVTPAATLRAFGGKRPAGEITPVCFARIAMGPTALQRLRQRASPNE